MNRKIIAAICLHLVVLPPALFAQQAKSASERSNLKARKVLEEAVKAVGGLDALQAVTNITREMAGVRTDQGQGLKPSETSNNQPRITSVIDLRGQRGSTHLRDVVLGGQPLDFRSVVGASTVFSVDNVGEFMRVSPPTAVASNKASLQRRYPETLLLVAWGRPETLRWIDEDTHNGRKQQVITFTDSEGALVTLYVDKETNLLTKIESLRDDPVLGDVTVEVVYGDYRPVDKLVLPFKYTDRVGGSVLQEVQASSITLNTKLDETLFTVPEGLTRFEQARPASPVTKLGDDTYLLTGGYNSIFVVFNDYVLVLEGGGNNRATQSAISEIKKVAPGKPIRYVVATHFHFDHVGGLRSYIAEGSTIVTTPSAKEVIQKAAAATHSMRPDALSRNPKTPVIEMAGKKRVFDDGVHRVELYDIGPNPHCNEIIIAYLPKQKILFEADLFDLDIPEGKTSAAGDDTADLAEKIKQLGLDVERIIPVHGRAGSIAELQQALEKRAAASSKIK